MGRNKNKKRSHSSSSSSSSSSCDRKRYRSKLKKKERRIDALEDIIKVLRNSYHTGNENNEQGTESVSSVPTAVPGPSSGGNASLPIVRYVGRNDFIPDFDPQTTNVPVEHWIRNLESTARMHEAADVVVIKTASQLSFFKREMALELAELCEDTGKVQLHPQEDVTLEPGINKVFVWTTPAVNATLKVNQSEQRQPMYEKDVVCEEVESDNGSAILKIINRTNAPIKIKCEECIARAELVETPECSEAMPNIGEQLTDKQRKEVISLLRDYDDCFSGSAMALGNCDIEMVIKLREDKIVNYKPYRMSYHEREVVRNVVSELYNIII
ncbi:hypothetical protein JYU34_003031 [Plutella xylostella]|uniref:Uncharacterized protein n=1 Tax=Plutella xylostella TaxID=51655 RepID=A0ABQ7QZ10_PLUXY|nr:hypothetical protein JYU34_003031 [Plutella xylostella]